MKDLRKFLVYFTLIPAIAIMFAFPATGISQQTTENHEQATDHAMDTTKMEGHEGEESHACHFHGDIEETEFDATNTAYHHIADANVYSIGSFNFPLPCILYSKGQGMDMFSSKKFDFEFYGHGDGHKAYNRYVLTESQVKHIVDPSFPLGEADLEGFTHDVTTVDGKTITNVYACFQGKHYLLEAQSTADGGLFGGGLTSFYDFSITKNVLSMILISLLLGWAFFGIAKAYRNRATLAPKGLQSLVEPIFLFIQDEVAKPFLGPKWEKFLPMLCALFFFILALNLFGQIPFLGGSNVTGNLAVTAVLALVAFVVVTINGNKHYWSHIVWMPGVPAIIKILILTPVEILGVFIKPFTLMLRLFANITAGHIVVLSFVGLIFVFGKMGQSVAGAAGGFLVAAPLTMFIMAIELLVAFIQAYVFTLLVASYIGAATEEHHAEKH
ncbi:MAG: F0F1 ATP synthase subunit A [Saprospiraceae bacterium]|uniref:ATP synthase subunit a n=1 Tax=Candidatus Opimibacter skivensis TaxID=2982028 RepID=A0A9D7T0A9_9BACT|nr:F0F1 ATP synthase subunit A [Candidatus Opimibacter skivensis]